MKQQLYVLRHAHTDPWSPLGNDFSRSLSSNGEQHARRLADWASDRLTMPDTVLCSPAKRTRQTLSPLLAQWPRLLSATDYVDSMYNASLTLLLTLAEDAFSYSERLFMIGHNPGIGHLLVNVLEQRQADEIGHMVAGTMAVVEFPDGFRRGASQGELQHLIVEKDLSNH